MEIPNYVRRGVCVHLIKRGRDKLVVEPDCLRSGGESKGELMCAFGMEGCVPLVWRDVCFGCRYEREKESTYRRVMFRDCRSPPLAND
jgi:hypothetical protein